VVADDEQTWRGCAQEARRIGTIAADDRLAAACVLEDELIDERWIARQGIAEQILTDPESEADDRAGFGNERGWVDPHVVSEERRPSS
jgi:hypothetical protein